MNNRKIKFRAWDKLEKKFIYYTDVEGLLYHCDEKYIELNIKNKMQFTGLYDKTKWEELTENEREKWTIKGNLPSEWKGKKIYKGDIVNIGEPGFAMPEIVIFQKGCYGIEASWIGKVYERFIPLKEYCNEIFEGCVKIIGNIYENEGAIK